MRIAHAGMLFPLCLLWCAGCVSMHSKDFCPVADSQLISPTPLLPTVAYELTAFHEGEQGNRRLKLLQERTECVFTKSNAFEDVCCGTGCEPFRVSLMLDRRKEITASHVPEILVSTLSLTLIPASIEPEYTIHATVLLGDEVVDDFVVAANCRMMSSVILLPMNLLHSPDEIEAEVIDQLLAQVVLRMNDGPAAATLVASASNVEGKE